MNFVTRVREMDWLDWMEAIGRGVEFVYKAVIIVTLAAMTYALGLVHGHKLTLEGGGQEAGYQCFTFPPHMDPTEMPIPRPAEPAAQQ